MSEHQEERDRQLIMGWRKNRIMIEMVKRFVRRFKPELIDNEKIGSFMETREFIDSLGLRRCMDRDGDGSLSFRVFKGTVRTFFYHRARKTNDWLWGHPGFLLDDAVNVLVANKWLRQNMGRVGKDAYVKHRKSRLKIECNPFVRARSIKDKHDWGTIK